MRSTYHPLLQQMTDAEKENAYTFYESDKDSLDGSREPCPLSDQEIDCANLV